MNNMETNASWTNRVAVVTGGGRGMGKAHSVALAARGARVVLLDMDGEAARAAADEIRSQGGIAAGITCDVSDEENVGRTMAEIAAEHGGIDLLINNAALHSTAFNQSMQAMGIEKIRQLFDVNVIGIFICSLAAHAFMRGRDGANIINISSVAAYGCETTYGVTKLAVQGVTMTLAREFSRDGIRANAISPGIVLTDKIREDVTPDQLAQLIKLQLLEIEGAERDVVEAMLYLASPQARFITGETLRVAAGYALAI
jgi:NAD(P)-dependent dehydrogenase (short-subunit alcohol dehydrogenase family)